MDELINMMVQYLGRIPTEAEVMIVLRASCDQETKEILQRMKYGTPIFRC